MNKEDRIYMDHAGATPVHPRVIECMQPFFALHAGNPSAIHKEGVFTRKAIEAARQNIAVLLDAHADEIVFTGSATESTNLALFGAVRSWQNAHHGRVPHVITSVIEHNAVLEPLRRLESLGVRVTRLPVDVEGVVDPKAVNEALTEDTVLVSVMYANNEIGTIQPIKEIAKVIRKWKKEFRDGREAATGGNDKEKNRYPLFHTDACQATNFLDMSVLRLGVDLLTCNAAKIYGPKGVGLLWLARGVPLSPIILGGGHEQGLRAGTENVPAIIGFGEAFTIAREMAESETSRLYAIRDYAFLELQKSIPDIVINGSKTQRLPNNIHFSLSDVDHEFLAVALDARGFAVATKSACNELDAEISHVLVALRNRHESAAPQSGIRLSLGRDTTAVHIDLFVAALQDILATLIVRI